MFSRRRGLALVEPASAARPQAQAQAQAWLDETGGRSLAEVRQLPSAAWRTPL